MPDIGLPVTPGYIFDPSLPNGGESVDLTKLNELGQPVVLIPEGAIPLEQFDPGLQGLITGIAGRNYIDNGDFGVWQRGVIFTTGTPAIPAEAEKKKYIVLTADRWGVSKFISNATVSKQALINGSINLPASDAFLRWVQATPLNINPGFLATRMENVGSLAGGDATVSLRASSPNNITIGVQLVQHFGFGGSPSADEDSPVQNFAITGGIWRPIEATFTLPQIYGKVQGTHPLSTDWLELRLIGPQGMTFTLDIGQVKVEAGSKATPFLRMQPAESLVRCQRFVENVNGLVSPDITDWRTNVYYKVTKRITPSVVVTTLNAGTGAAFYSLSPPEMTYQITNNSVVALATLRITAEMFRSFDGSDYDT